MVADRLSFYWQIFLATLATSLISAMLTYGFLGGFSGRWHRRQAERELESLAKRIGERILPDLLAERFDEVARRLSPEFWPLGDRVTVVLPSGRVVADSHADMAELDLHDRRPEVAQALQTGQPAPSTRFSYTLRQRLLYVAVPVGAANGPAAVVRTARPEPRVLEELVRFRAESSVVLITVGLVAVALCFWAAAWLNRPLAELNRWVHSPTWPAAAQRPLRKGPSDLLELGNAVRQLGEQLEQHRASAAQAQRTLQAVVATVPLGIVLADPAGQIKSLNAVAAGILRVAPGQAAGRQLLESLRSSAVADLLEQLRLGGTPPPAEFSLPGRQEQLLRITAGRVGDEAGRTTELLLVLEDVTYRRRLDLAHKQLVASVGHELRTPLTSIRGYAETLLEGALDDAANARRFLQTIVAQSDRMLEMIVALLNLSRLEQDAEASHVDMEPLSVADILHAAEETCRPEAEGKSIQVQIDCPELVQVRGNRRLLQQALVNLLDNAIKFSPAGSVVALRATRVADRIHIAVEDQGCGIEARHLAHVFEPFYRVPQAESSGARGSGIGLALVRQIALVHGGSASAESRPGQGSRFSLALPAV